MNGKFHFCDWVKIPIDPDDLSIDIVKTNTHGSGNSTKFNEFRKVEISNGSDPSTWIILLFR